jgi:hypothetical protein
MGPSLRTPTSFPYGAGCSTLENRASRLPGGRRASSLAPLSMLTACIVPDASSYQDSILVI